MTRFVDVPQDVFLRILYDMEVEDILCLERTCTYLRDIISLRHLWIVKLESLDQACAPDLPPHVDINELSSTQLRSIVVKAMQLYYSLTKGESPMAKYELKRVIYPLYSEGLRHRLILDDVKIAPGGRYLFTYLVEDGPHLWWRTRNVRELARELRVLDLENEDRCVWSYKFSEVQEPGTIGYSNCYDFEVCRDGSIMIALSTMERPEESAGKILFRLFRLAPESASHTAFQATLVNTIETKFGVMGPFLLGDFVLYSTRDSQETTTILNIVDWKADRTVKLQCDITISPPYQIWHDYLFYTDHVVPKSMCALSLTQAFSLVPSHILHDSSELVISRIPIPVQRPEEVDNILYSVYDSPWKDSHTAMVSIITVKSLSFCLSFGAARAMFDPRGSGSAKWMLLQVALSKTQRGVDAEILTKMTQSGRLLFSYNIEPGYGYGFRVIKLAVIDRHGTLRFPCLSKKGFTIPSCSKLREKYIEQYSSMLVHLKEKGTTMEGIELYYPKVRG